MKPQAYGVLGARKLVTEAPIVVQTDEANDFIDFGTLARLNVKANVGGPAMGTDFNLA